MIKSIRFLFALPSITGFPSKSLKFLRPVISSVLLGLMAMPVQAVVSIGPQVIVTGTTIQVLEPGSDLQAIIDGIDDESAAKPYLIKLGPGVYDIAADITTSMGLVMAPYISIMGSGQGVTILWGSISAVLDGTSSILIGADNATLSHLDVENTGTGTYSIGISNIGTSPRIEYVTAIASGTATNNYGIVNASSSAPTMSNVTATASGETNNFGILNTSSSPTMSHVTATASGPATNCYAIFNVSSSPTMSNITATASGGANSYAIRNQSSSPTMSNVTAKAMGGLTNHGITNISSSPTMSNVTAKGSGGSSNYGIFNTTNTSNPQINFSSLEGSTVGIWMGQSTGTRIMNTLIVGVVGDDNGATNCRDTYNAALADVAC